MTAASGAARPRPTARPAWHVLLSVLGLAVWAGHFAAIYASNAVACERGLVGERLLGLPWVVTMVGGATLVASAALASILLAALPGLPRPLYEAGETEPRFTRWLAAATTVLAGLAVVFEAVPAMVLPPCG